MPLFALCWSLNRCALPRVPDPPSRENDTAPLPSFVKMSHFRGSDLRLQGVTSHTGFRRLPPFRLLSLVFSFPVLVGQESRNTPSGHSGWNAVPIIAQRSDYAIPRTRTCFQGFRRCETVLRYRFVWQYRCATLSGFPAKLGSASKNGQRPHHAPDHSGQDEYGP